MKQKINDKDLWRHRGRWVGVEFCDSVWQGGGGDGGGQKVTKFAWRHFWTAPYVLLWYN